MRYLIKFWFVGLKKPCHIWFPNRHWSLRHPPISQPRLWRQDPETIRHQHKQCCEQARSSHRDWGGNSWKRQEDQLHRFLDVGLRHQRFPRPLSGPHTICHVPIWPSKIAGQKTPIQIQWRPCFLRVFQSFLRFIGGRLRWYWIRFQRAAVQQDKRNPLLDTSQRNLWLGYVCFPISVGWIRWWGRGPKHNIRSILLTFQDQGSFVKKCVFNKRTIKVYISCCWQRPWTTALTQHTCRCPLSMYLCSSGSNARGESRALEGCCVSSKSPSRVWDQDAEFATGKSEPFLS